LPDFKKPPLDEVVMGIQFPPPQNYDDRRVAQVWESVRSDLPKYEEQMRLDPVFEVFGAPGLSVPPMMHIEFGSAAFGPFGRKRYWFIAEDETHLLQYQDDRLLFNWRRRPGNEAYPRFDSILPRYEQILRNLSPAGIFADGTIRQVEVSYINMITLEGSTNIADWLTLVRPTSLEIDSLNSIFSEAVRDANGGPVARLHHEFGLLARRDGARWLRLAMTFRGPAPPGNIEDALEFLQFGRKHILNRFVELTTDQAHKLWERTT
jgi:uncharacterized protein (TIGR04255 family)